MNTGISRTRVTDDHALIAPDSHVTSELPAWTNAEVIVLVSPQMGAGFTQYIVEATTDTELEGYHDTRERLIFLEGGSATLNKESDASGSTTLNRDDYLYLPPREPVTMSVTEGGRFLVFEKTYNPLEESRCPPVVTGTLSELEKEPFMGDPDARLQTLLPDDELFDFGAYVFNFEPGATLPMVECHFMEHGLFLLDGQGIYRLNDDWYPVEEGDAIWMAPYLPQWFAAIGKKPSRYLYYKDTNRHPAEAYS